jgi:hypothetical protein
MEEVGVFTTLVQVLFYLLLLVGLYYLYQYLFGASTSTVVSTLIDSKQAADTSKAITISATSLPALHEGGEFSISMWVYIQNWNYRQGFNKHILSIGGQNFDTIRIYLAPDRNAMKIRVHTRDSGAVTEKAAGDSLLRSDAQKTFGTLQTGADLIEGSSTSGCNIPEIDMQRWVNVVVALNGKTCDVFLDGKLARSCVLPSFYKVDHAGYQATLLANGGFGGFIAGVVAYGNALSPDEVYRQYMAGPDANISLIQWLKSFFEPQKTINTSS